MASEVTEPEADAAEVADLLGNPFELVRIGESSASAVPFRTTYSPRLALHGLHTLGCLGLTALARGHLRAAQALAEEALETARCGNWSEGPQARVATVVLAMVHLERNHLTEAGQLLDSCGHVHEGNPDPTDVAVQVAHARFLFAVGRLAHARSIVQGLSGARREPPAMVSPWLMLVVAELDLAAGHSLAVRGRARPRFGASGQVSDRVRVVLAREQLALGNLARVDTILAGVQKTSRNPIARTEALLVTALAADRRRNDYQAMHALEDALAVAEPENVRRPFLTGGPRLRSMLHHRQRLTPDLGQFVTGLLDEYDAPDGTVIDRTTPSVPLSDREQMILRHMATLQTNRDIAADLWISVNTVKAHAKSVYRKLAVPNRREAVVRARELGLI